MGLLPTGRRLAKNCRNTASSSRLTHNFTGFLGQSRILRQIGSSKRRLNSKPSGITKKCWPVPWGFSWIVLRSGRGETNGNAQHSVKHRGKFGTIVRASRLIKSGPDIGSPPGNLICTMLGDSRTITAESNQVARVEWRHWRTCFGTAPMLLRGGPSWSGTGRGSGLLPRHSNTTLARVPADKLPAYPRTGKHSLQTDFRRIRKRLSECGSKYGTFSRRSVRPRYGLTGTPRSVRRSRKTLPAPRPVFGLHASANFAHSRPERIDKCLRLFGEPCYMRASSYSNTNRKGHQAYLGPAQISPRILRR